MSGCYLGRDEARAVAMALVESAAAAGLRLSVRTGHARPWASATFTGTRHRLELEVEGPAGARGQWLADVAEAELALPHHIAADVSAQETGPATVAIEVLTVAKA